MDMPLGALLLFAVFGVFTLFFSGVFGGALAHQIHTKSFPNLLRVAILWIPTVISIQALHKHYGFRLFPLFVAMTVMFYVGFPIGAVVYYKSAGFRQQETRAWGAFAAIFAIFTATILFVAYRVMT